MNSISGAVHPLVGGGPREYEITGKTNNSILAANIIGAGDDFGKDEILNNKIRGLKPYQLFSVMRNITITLEKTDFGKAKITLEKIKQISLENPKLNEKLKELYNQMLNLFINWLFSRQSTYHMTMAAQQVSNIKASEKYFENIFSEEGSDISFGDISEIELLKDVIMNMIAMMKMFSNIGPEQEEGLGILEEYYKNANKRFKEFNKTQDTSNPKEESLGYQRVKFLSNSVFRKNIIPTSEAQLDIINYLIKKTEGETDVSFLKERAYLLGETMKNILKELGKVFATVNDYLKVISGGNVFDISRTSHEVSVSFGERTRPIETGQILIDNSTSAKLVSQYITNLIFYMNKVSVPEEFKDKVSYMYQQVICILLRYFYIGKLITEIQKISGDKKEILPDFLSTMFESGKQESLEAELKKFLPTEIFDYNSKLSGMMKNIRSMSNFILGESTSGEPEIMSYIFEEIAQDNPDKDKVWGYIIKKLLESEPGQASYFALSKCVQENIDKIPDTILMKFIMSIMEKTDKVYSPGHSRRVGDLCNIFHEEYKSSDEMKKFEETDKLLKEKCPEFYEITGGLLGLLGSIHDWGKNGSPNASLGSSGRLNSQEFSEIKRHVSEKPQDIIFEEMMARLPEQVKDFVYEVINGHHAGFNQAEKTRFYPKMNTSELSFVTHLIAMADVFDAMAGDRVYKKGLSLNFSLFEIIRASAPTKDGDQQLNPRLIEMFYNMLSTKPGIKMLIEDFYNKTGESNKKRFNLLEKHLLKKIMEINFSEDMMNMFFDNLPQNIKNIIESLEKLGMIFEKRNSKERDIAKYLETIQALQKLNLA